MVMRVIVRQSERQRQQPRALRRKLQPRHPPETGDAVDLGAFADGSYYGCISRDAAEETRATPRSSGGWT